MIANASRSHLPFTAPGFLALTREVSGVLRALAALGLLVSLAVQLCAAQNASVRYSGPRNYDGVGDISYVFDGSKIDGESDNDSGTHTFSVAVSDLDLVRLGDQKHDDLLARADEGRYVMDLWCKDDRPCVANSAPYFRIWCSSASECAAFLKALRGASAGSGRAANPARVDPASAGSGPAVGPGPGNGSGSVVNPGPSVSDTRDKRLPPEPTSQQKEAQKLLDEARDLVKPTPVDCNALRSTYYSGPQRVMPPECVTDLDRASTYVPVYGPGQAPPQPSGLRIEDIIDGSKIPSLIEFSGAPKNALERVFVGPPVPPTPSAQPVPSPDSDLDRAPNTPSTVPQPRISEAPLPGTTLPHAADDASPLSGDATTAKGDMSERSLSETAREAWEKTRDAYNRIFGPPSGEPMRKTGAPDDTLANHQADVDKATGFFKMVNPVKGPLESQQVVHDKMDRILDGPPPER